MTERHTSFSTEIVLDIIFAISEMNTVELFGGIEPESDEESMMSD